MQETQEMWFRSLGWEDPLEGGNGNPLQYSCLENSTDRGAWWATVHGVEESDMTEWACVCACAHAHTHTVQFNKLFLLILLKVPETKWITKCF